jgi:hypothetical protein
LSRHCFSAAGFSYDAKSLALGKAEAHPVDGFGNAPFRIEICLKVLYFKQWRIHAKEVLIVYMKKDS